MPVGVRKRKAMVALSRLVDVMASSASIVMAGLDSVLAMAVCMSASSISRPTHCMLGTISLAQMRSWPSPQPMSTNVSMREAF